MCYDNFGRSECAESKTARFRVSAIVTQACEVLLLEELRRAIMVLEKLRIELVGASSG